MASARRAHPTAAALSTLALDTALVPTLFWFELRNLLVANERRGRLDATKSMQALRLVMSLPVSTDDDVDESELMRMARMHRLTAYDAAYLELAARRAAPLATLDAALLLAARAEAVALIGPAPGP